MSLERFQFEARPEPDNVTWLIEGDQDILIAVSPDEERTVGNYVVYPLEQVISSGMKKVHT